MRPCAYTRPKDNIHHKFEHDWRRNCWVPITFTSEQKINHLSKHEVFCIFLSFETTPQTSPQPNKTQRQNPLEVKTWRAADPVEQPCVSANCQDLNRKGPEARNGLESQCRGRRSYSDILGLKFILVVKANPPPMNTNSINNPSMRSFVYIFPFFLNQHRTVVAFVIVILIDPLEGPTDPLRLSRIRVTWLTCPIQQLIECRPEAIHCTEQTWRAIAN